MGKTGFRIALVLLAILPIIGGSLGLIRGPAVLGESADLGLNTTSFFRYFSVFYLAAGITLLWAAVRPGARRQILTFVLAVVFVGGLSRLYSAVVDDGVTPLTATCALVEVFVPPLLVWWSHKIEPATV